MNYSCSPMVDARRSLAPWGVRVSGLLIAAILASSPLSAGSTNVATVVDEHCDFRILYDPQETNALSIVLRDEDRGLNYRTNEVVLVVAESARVALPPGTEFGEEGEDFWLLAQGQVSDLLYLGVSAEGIPLGTFAGRMNLRLIGVAGPGDFFAWQAGDLGGLDIRMNSRDGIGEEDRTTPIAGSHEHMNWGFTTNGVYQITFQAEGRRVGEATNVVSEPSTFTFHVLPLPEVPLRLANAQSVREGSPFTFDLFGSVGATCTIEVSTDLRSWAALTTVRLDTSPVRVSIDDPAPVRGFYRAVQR